MPNFYVSDEIEGDHMEDIWERKIKCFLDNIRGEEWKHTGTNKPRGNIYGR